VQTFRCITFTAQLIGASFIISPVSPVKPQLLTWDRDLHEGRLVFAGLDEGVYWLKYCCSFWRLYLLPILRLLHNNVKLFFFHNFVKVKR